MSAATSPRDERPAPRRVARNTVFRAAAEVLGKLASLFLFAFIARSLGASTLGAYVLALSIGQLIWAFAGFGLDQMALRDIARKRESAVERLFFEVIGFKAFFGTLAVGLVTVGFLLFAGSGQLTLLVLVLGTAALLMLVTETAQTVFQAYERMEYYLLAYLPNKVLGAVAGIAVLAAGAGIMAVAISALAAAVIALAVAVLLVYRFFARPSPRFRPREWSGLARAAAPFGLQEAFGVVLYRADVVLLSILTTSGIVGIYGAAYRLVEGTFFLAISIGQSVLPMFAYLDSDSSPTLDRALEGSLKLTAAVMMPVAIVFLVCAEPLIDLFYGLPEYADAVPVLRWLAFGTLAYAVANLVSTFILVHLPGRTAVIVFASTAALNLALNLALIPPLEAVGAAIATLASETCLVAVVLVQAYRVVDTPNWVTLAGGIVAAGAAMAAAMLPLAGTLWVALPAGLVAYGGVLLLAEARNAPADLEIIRIVLRGSRSAKAPGTALPKPTP